MKGDRLGEFEEMVLLAAGVLGKEASAVSIQAVLHERADRRVVLGSLYGALDQLQRKGCLASEVRDATQPRERRKRFFALTERGIETLAAVRQVRERLWAELPMSCGTSTGRR